MVILFFFLNAQFILQQNCFYLQTILLKADSQSNNMTAKKMKKRNEEGQSDISCPYRIAKDSNRVTKNIRKNVKSIILNFTTAYILIKPLMLKIYVFADDSSHPVTIFSNRVTSNLKISSTFPLYN